MSSMPPPPPAYEQAPQMPPPPKKNMTLIIVITLVGGCFLCIPVLAALIFPVFSQAKESALEAVAMSNLKQTGTSALIYSVDYDDQLPISDSWMDGLLEYTKVKAVFQSPKAAGKNPDLYGFAFMKELSTKATLKLKSPQTTPMIFDSILLQWNASSGLETLPAPGRYRRSSGPSNAIVNVDGHAEFVVNR